MSHLRVTSSDTGDTNRAVSTPRARLYVKDNCELCDSARDLLRPLERSERLKVEIVDIATDRDLLLRYGFSIPVLEIDGGPRLYWPFDQSDLKRALR